MKRHQENFYLGLVSLKLHFSISFGSLFSFMNNERDTMNTVNVGRRRNNAKDFLLRWIMKSFLQTYEKILQKNFKNKVEMKSSPPSGCFHYHNMHFIEKWSKHIDFLF